MKYYVSKFKITRISDFFTFYGSKDSESSDILFKKSFRRLETALFFLMPGAENSTLSETILNYFFNRFDAWNPKYLQTAQKFLMPRAENLTFSETIFTFWLIPWSKWVRGTYSHQSWSSWEFQNPWKFERFYFFARHNLRFFSRIKNEHETFKNTKGALSKMYSKRK